MPSSFSLVEPQAVEAAIGECVESFMDAFEIPGAAIVVVRPDQPDFLRAFGYRVAGKSERVDLDTRFAIASNSKAFLAACLAILVDEGRIGWDDPVIRYLPYFEMHDPVATHAMTIRDLLVHRSGLPLGAGDLAQVRRSHFTAEDVLRSLRHFKPERGFRSGYAYDNCLYIVAGLVLKAVTGLAWSDFVAQRVFAPLGMTGAVGDPTLVQGGNVAGRHSRLGPPVIGMGPVVPVAADETSVNGPAGGIVASPAEMLAWLHVQLGRGALPDGRRLWSETQANEMWTPQTIISSGPGPMPDAPHRTVMEAYALGWGVADFRGHRMLTHGGQLAGQVTRTALLPDDGIAIGLYTNSAEADALSALRYAILDILLGAPPFDWLAAARHAIAEGQAEVRRALGEGDFPAPEGTASLPLQAYAGRYRDSWYGDILVTEAGGKLAIDFLPTPAFVSELEPFGTDSFRTRFAYGVGEDAIVTFAVSSGTVSAVTMKALSPLADFSFDYHHLGFVPTA